MKKPYIIRLILRRTLPLVCSPDRFQESPQLGIVYNNGCVIVYLWKKQACWNIFGELGHI